ncbi:MAG: OmpH family outer membrane protein [Rickettsiales bacterium]
MTKHKWFTSLLRHACKVILYFFLLSSTSSFADPSKIVVLNFDYVIGNSNIYKKLKTSTDTLHAKYQKEIAGYENQIIELAKKIETDKTLNEKEAEILRNDLNQREMKIQKLLQKRRLSINETHSKKINHLRSMVLEIAHKEAKKHGYTAILSASAVIYTVDSLDISDRILKILNEETAE